MTAIEAGTVIGGRYRLDAPIGAGGMGSIWRATHLTLETPVAVKLLESYGSSRKQMTQRFMREAKIAAALRHRHVVQILDFGVMDDGQPYMVMELLEGESLADRMEGEARPSDLALLEYVGQLLGGLAAVHEAGIIHRDIKPDNVFLVRDADGDYAKLLDFGVSRGVDPGAEQTQMTRTGAVIGTPHYMSPEQARGMKDLDARTDLWAVGVILFEGLVGEVPFDSEYVGDVLIQVATEDVPSLATRRSDLPREVVELVDRALVRDRSGRTGTARQMREAVTAAIAALRAPRDSIVAPPAATSAAPGSEAGPAQESPGEPDPRPSTSETSRALSARAIATLDERAEPAAKPTVGSRRGLLWAAGALAAAAVAVALASALGTPRSDEPSSAAPRPPAAAPGIDPPAAAGDSTLTAPAQAPEPAPEPTADPPAGAVPPAAEAPTEPAAALEPASASPPDEPASATRPLPRASSSATTPAAALPARSGSPPLDGSRPSTRTTATDQPAQPASQRSSSDTSSRPPSTPRERGNGAFVRDLDY
jgi:serine/threonine protein kinase